MIADHPARLPIPLLLIYHLLPMVGLLFFDWGIAELATFYIFEIAIDAYIYFLRLYHAGEVGLWANARFLLWFILGFGLYYIPLSYLFLSSIHHHLAQEFRVLTGENISTARVTLSVFDNSSFWVAYLINFLLRVFYFRRNLQYFSQSDETLQAKLWLIFGSLLDFGLLYFLWFLAWGMLQFSIQVTAILYILVLLKAAVYVVAYLLKMKNLSN